MADKKVKQVRNFWIEAEIDGQASKLAGGPRAKDGGMDITLYIRDRGQIRKALTIGCVAEADGTLGVYVHRSDDLSEINSPIVTQR